MKKYEGKMKKYEEIEGKMKKYVKIMKKYAPQAWAVGLGKIPDLPRSSSGSVTSRRRKVRNFQV
mgnify:CR=1 FL=1